MVNFNPIDYDYTVRWQSDLENTKERLHKIKESLLHWVELEILQNGAFNGVLENVLVCAQLAHAT